MQAPITPNVRLLPNGQAHKTSGFELSDVLLSKVFPCHLALNSNLQIVQMGEAIRQLCPQVILGNELAQHFLILRPNVALEFEVLCQQQDTMALLEDQDHKLLFEGQVIYSNAHNLLFFLGTLRLEAPTTLRLARQQLTERPAAGATSDLLLLLQARTASLSDTRRLAEKLASQRSNLERALRQAEIATAVLDQSTDAIEVLNAEKKIVYVNTVFQRLTGYDREEVLGQTPASLFGTNQYKDMTYEEVWQAVSTGEIWQGVFVGQQKNGTPLQQATIIFPLRSKSDRITHYVITKRDLSHCQLPQDLDTGGNSLSLLQATFEATADGILVTNIHGEILNYNRKFLDLLQVSDADLQLQPRPSVGLVLKPLLRQQDEIAVQLQALYAEPHLESHDILELKSGRFLESRSHPQRMANSVIGRVWTFQDVTERQRTEARIRYQASHDLLTGLPNRMLFNERLATSLLQAADNQSQLAVMFLDLDRFKIINDSLGHAAGDQLLQEVARRLKSCLRDSDTVARWAGDEFTLLLPNVTSVEDAVLVAQKILHAMKPDYNLEGHTLHVTSSIGISIYPSDGDDAEALLKNADAALYQAKDAGRNGYHVYTSAMNSEAVEWLALENHLHRALERQEFILHYQPQVNVVTGEITQMEALLRWQHPERGLVPPGKFIPIAEENGLIVQIGEWVLRTACAQNRAWQKMGLSPIRIAVNLSAHQLRQPKLVDMVQRVLQETGLASRYLELEITETTVMKNVELTTTILRELNQMGVSTAMDDFGTGYSSLSYLKKFPFDTLKIDQSFVRDLTTDPNDKAIVAAIIAMGRVLNLKLVAEGVETKVQEHSLLSLDCEEMQGYLFSHPLPVDDATRLLIAYSSRL